MKRIVYKTGLILESHETPRNTVEIDESRMGIVRSAGSQLSFDGEELRIDVRTGGEFQDKALYLPGNYDWVLCADTSDTVCLVPLKMVCD